MVAGSAFVFSGCGDITGESPRIEADETPAVEQPETTPVPEAAQATPAGSGWNSVAERAFGLPVVERSTTGPEMAQVAAGETTGAVAYSSEPALTAPAAELADAASLYLRNAQEASVHWRMWGQGAFDEAAARNVSTIIVIGAAWSHDARQMDYTAFSNEGIASVLNEKFVPIRVDADERPDVWARYRMAYEVINKQRARPPLVVFAMPDGRPYDIVSYVPAQSEGDVVGLQQLLEQAEGLMTEQPEAVTEQATAIEGVLEQLLAAPRVENAEFSKETVVKLAGELQRVASGDDAELIRAGRVSAFLLHYGSAESSSDARNRGSELLLSRYRSGQRDHVMGGYFFRIPGSGDIQFGKILPIQSEMILANARGDVLASTSLHKEAVTEVMRFCHDWLEDPNGGFYTAQSPDLGDDDDGSYFTWTQEEIREIAGDEKKATVFSSYLNAERGKKTVLHVTGRLQNAADAAGVSYQEADRALDEVRLKLNEARMEAENVPMVDKSILAGWNADMVCAYLRASKLIDYDRAREFALKTADMIIENMVSERDGVARVFYRGQASGYGFLEDNVKVAAALLECHKVTDQAEYLESAQSLMAYVESQFLDQGSGLYRDHVKAGSSERTGLLRLKYLPIEDDIARAPNAVAAMVWFELHEATGNAEFKERGDRMIKAALERRLFTTEAMATWGEAALLSLHGSPSFNN